MFTVNSNSVFEKIHGEKLYLHIIEKDNPRKLHRKPSSPLPPFLMPQGQPLSTPLADSFDISLHIAK